MNIKHMNEAQIKPGDVSEVAFEIYSSSGDLVYQDQNGMYYLKLGQSYTPKDFQEIGTTIEDVNKALEALAFTRTMAEKIEKLEAEPDAWTIRDRAARVETLARTAANMFCDMQTDNGYQIRNDLGHVLNILEEETEKLNDMLNAGGFPLGTPL